jgi:hypothetical protein
MCEFLYGGILDGISAGPAIDLGGGRIAQPDAGGSWSDKGVLVVDCNTRQATLLFGPEDRSQSEDSCIGFPHKPLMGAGRVADLRLPGSLHDLEDSVLAVGGRSGDPNSWNYDEAAQKPVPVRDNIDLLCGCKLHYPESAGGRG